ncbi:MAG: hypothetical protein ACP5N7_03560, partial [Candidatus Pacearchaeota archaeon]
MSNDPRGLVSMFSETVSTEELQNLANNARNSSDCQKAKKAINDNQRLKLGRDLLEARAGAGSTSFLNPLIQGLLSDVSDLLGAEFSNLISEELSNTTGPAAYFGAAITAYITVLATVPNVVMAIPYLLTENLKKYLKIRIAATDYILSVMQDLEMILRSIPINATPSHRTLTEFKLALVHLKKCLEMLQTFRSQVSFTIETRSGYVSQNLFHRGVHELDAAIRQIQGQQSNQVVNNISDEEAENLAKRFLSNSLDSNTNDLAVRTLTAYFKKYGPSYVLILRLIRKLEFIPGESMKKLLSGKRVFEKDDSIPEINETVEDLIEDYPLFALVVSTPIIEAYISALSKILNNVKLLKGLSPGLQDMLSSMFMPLDGAVNIIKGVKEDIEGQIKDKSTELSNHDLEFSKVGYVSRLQAARVLLYGMDTRSNGASGGADVIAETANLMSALQSIQDYINSPECLRGSKHPVSDLDGQILGLIPKLLSTLSDVKNRQEVIKQITKIKATCRASKRYDNRLLSKLNSFDPTKTAWFEEALNTYKLVANNLDLGDANSLVYNPVQINLAKKIGFGIVDGLLLGYAFLDTIVHAAILDRNSAWVGIKELSNIITDAAASVFNCSQTHSGDSVDTRMLKQLEQKAPLT